MKNYIATKSSLWVNCTTAMTHVVVFGIFGADAPQFDVLMDEIRTIESLVNRGS